MSGSSTQMRFCVPTGTTGSTKDTTGNTDTDTTDAADAVDAADVDAVDIGFTTYTTTTTKEYLDVDGNIETVVTVTEPSILVHTTPHALCLADRKPAAALHLLAIPLHVKVRDVLSLRPTQDDVDLLVALREAGREALRKAGAKAGADGELEQARFLFHVPPQVRKEEEGDI